MGEDVVEGGGAVGGGVKLRADAADRPERLGCEQDRDERRTELERAGRQAQADRHRDDRDRDRREQLERGRAQERQTQGAHGGPTVPLAHLTNRAHLSFGPTVGHKRRQPLHDVEEVPAEGGERRPTSRRLVGGRPADERSEQGEQRHGERDDDGARPVDHHERRDRQHRHDGCRDERWQKARGIRFHRRCPRGGERDRSGGLGPRVGVEGRPTPQQGGPQGGRDRDPGPRGHAFGEARQQGPEGEEGGQPGDGRPERVSLHDGHDERGQGEGGADRRSPREHADDAEHADRPPGGGHDAQQSRVERSHVSSARRCRVRRRARASRRPGCASWSGACGRSSRSRPGRGSRSG